MSLCNFTKAFLVMENQQLIPHLFRTEYRKITSVLCKHFGIAHIEVAEDIASDTFLAASEVWGIKGLPENPVAWLYTVAKNKAKNHLKRDSIFNEKISAQLKHSSTNAEEIEIDLSSQNITDSQLQMMFAICHPVISSEAQIGLALRILCGFGIEEIADAFLTNKENINKRLFRAKEKLRSENISIEFPADAEISDRLEAVLRTLYLLFNEGYYSLSHQTVLRKDLCAEAMRLTHMLTENEQTNIPAVNALLALMSFQASRFDARVDQQGEMILYDDQDESLWNAELIAQGEHYLDIASTGNNLSKYHLEAGIACWHTIKKDSIEKWENILQLYNHLLSFEYSPVAALNRTYAFSKARGKEMAIVEAEKLSLDDNYLYQTLLGELYSGVDNEKAVRHFKKALRLNKSAADSVLLERKIERLDPNTNN
jgi:RNA polymerase sigma-70 factor (ECF subfamily)